MGEMEREWRDGGEEKIKLGKMSRGGRVAMWTPFHCEEIKYLRV